MPGGINNGWKVANSTLAFERGMSATTGYRRFEEEFRIMLEAAKENGAIKEDSIRQRLMKYYSKYQILRYNGLRSLGATLEGKKDMGVIALGATNKMYWTEMHKEAMELALDIFGAHSMLIDNGPTEAGWPGAQIQPPACNLLGHSRLNFLRSSLVISKPSLNQPFGKFSVSQAYTSTRNASASGV